MHDGEDALVAEAIEDHYRPRFAGDELPRNDIGLIVALADKLETLAGLFGAGESPTGDKDPYALRRHALGVIRMLMERADAFGSLHIVTLMDIASNVAVFRSGVPNATGFIYERFSNLLREQGWTVQEIESVVFRRPRFADAIKRLDAVREFMKLPEAPALTAANKRVVNILKKSEQPADRAALRGELLHEPAEIALAEALQTVSPKAQIASEHGNYTQSLKYLAALKAPVDAFFDHVMVNADDPTLRANRLALLNQLHRTMNRVADLSRLAA